MRDDDAVIGHAVDDDDDDRADDRADDDDDVDVDDARGGTSRRCGAAGDRGAVRRR